MPKSKEQFEKIKEERKASILDSALYLFAMHGYDAVSSDDITKHAGCSHGLLYHYFKSKDELFNAVLNDVAKAKYMEIVGDTDFTKSPKEFLYDLLSSYLNALSSNRDDYVCTIYLLLNVHLQKKILPKVIEPKTQKPFIIFSSIYDAIEEGKKCGQFYDNDTREMTISILACLKGLSFTRMYLGNEFACPSVDIFMRMITK